jgi:malate dehydrogenase (oxaloacetate-decarboxylating)(NADP+)
VATGRSDYPNQVNNVLGFPFIFRGALDVRATAITDGMKLGATRALAALARQDVPDAVCQAYGVDRIEFGPDYIIPKPFDSRVLVWVTTAVAKAAMDDGVAQNPIDLAAYKEQLERRLGKAHELMRIMIQKARRDPQRVAFIEGEHDKVLRAAQILLDEQMAWPILLGNEAAIRKRIAELKLDLKDVKIIEPSCAPGHCKLGDELYRFRQRKGMTHQEAQRLIHDPSYYGAMMLVKDQCDALIGGIGKHYPETIRPALQVVPLKEGLHRVAGLYIVLTQKGDLYFFGDATVNIEPTAEDLAEIAIMAAGTVREFEIEPRVAMLSFSNFGSTRHKLADKVRRAVEIVHWRRPDIVIDGEMQADTAVVPEILTETYPFSPLKDAGANVLIFPDLEAGNVAYKLLAHLGGATVIGPILMGLGKAVHVLHTHATVDEIVNVAAIAVVDAQKK